jgi:hypothetical protein
MQFNPGITESSSAKFTMKWLVALSLAALLAAPMVTSVHAQTQYVTVTPGYINLGMVTTISVTGPAAGAYTVVVVGPDGTSNSLPFTFTSAGQVVNATYGNSTAGFKAVVNKVGTYNIFLEQGGQVVSSTAMSATNKLLVSMDMVDGGLCNPLSGAPRGTKLFPRFYVVYASTGAPMTTNSTGAYVTYNYPDGARLNASWHKPTAEAPNFAGSGGNTGFFIGKFQPNWNYTSVGPWIVSATAGDAAGNKATYVYSGPAFTLTPATLATNLQLVDSHSGALVTGLYNGQAVTVKATITYPTNAEPVSGFVGPLDAATRGGAVSALLGWGYYNATSNSFGSAKTPGGLIAQVPMTYSGANGTWVGNFTATSLPSLQAGATFVIVVNSADKASPSNTGQAIVTLPTATMNNVTTTATSVSTAVSTVTSTMTSVSSTATQAAGVPTVVYAGMAILLIIGLVIGYVMKVPRR